MHICWMKTLNPQNSSQELHKYVVVSVIQLIVHSPQQPVLKVLIKRLLNSGERRESQYGTEYSIYSFSEFLTFECCAY